MRGASTNDPFPPYNSKASQDLKELNWDEVKKDLFGNAYNFKAYIIKCDRGHNIRNTSVHAYHLL